MPKSLGAHQISECQRCGAKVLASFLVRDGYNKQLLVCNDSGCYDPPHPQEEPYRPRFNEGRAKYPIAPENLPPVTSLLEGSHDDSPQAWETDAWEDDPLAWLVGSWSEGEGGGGVIMSWERMLPVDMRVERYEIFRSVNDDEFALLATNTIQYSFIMEVENTPEEYIDFTITPSTTVQYYVEGVTGNGKRYRSNTITVDVGVSL